MEDLLADFGSSRPSPAVERLSRDNDLLSFDAHPPLFSHHSNGHTEPLVLDHAGSPNQRDMRKTSRISQRHGMEGTLADDSFGDFQGVSSLEPHPIAQTGVYSGMDILGDVGSTVDEDDFGEFVDTPRPDAGHFTGVETTGSSAVKQVMPGPAVLLSFILQTVLHVPEAFISELAKITYSMKRAVLNAPRTKCWLDAVCEGSRVAQRIIHGRDRRVKDEKMRRETRLTAERVAHEWQTVLMPRLSSLSGGSLRLRALKTNTYNDHYVEGDLCEVCGTEEDERTPLARSAKGLYGHRSCVALASQCMDSLGRQ